ncbi:MAG: C40 family peptidase [Eubacterium sp.]|nr:C40 family peptidase [Eubacterium sp.]
MLLIVPSLIILVAILLIDKPLPPKEEPAKQMAVTRQETSTREIQSSETTDREEYVDFDPIELTLVVGKTGSLKNGGSEPIYEDSNEESTVIAKLEFNCAVIKAADQLEKGWICVDLLEKGTGYVREDHVECVDVSFGSGNPVRDGIVKDAFSYLGLKFVRYGTSLQDGIDCSNFVQQIYGQNGIDTPRKPKNQAKAGQEISDEEILPGDLIYYDKANNGYGHIGIFMGDGFIINSSGHSGKTYPEGGVRLVRVLYPDRTSYKVISYLNEEGTEER